MAQHPYQTPLEPYSIRVVELLPTSTSTDVCMKFTTVDLSGDPEYIAMSYYWGDVTQMVPVRCGGQDSIMVSPTVRGLLYDLSQRAFALPFWIDAVCINQGNLAERNAQVALMAQIYSKAQKVIAWLGTDDTGDAPAVFESLTQVFELHAALTALHGRTLHLDTARALRFIHIPHCGDIAATLFPSAIFGPTKDEVKRLSTFFQLPWFSRTWVLQETGLASDAELLWGKRTIKWHVLGVTVLYLWRFAQHHLRSLSLLDRVNSVRIMYLSFSPFSPRTTFLHLLDDARRFQALDPRDKVFALLSHPTSRQAGWSEEVAGNVLAFDRVRHLVLPLISDVHDNFLTRNDTRHSRRDGPPRRQPLVTADYAQSVTEVYRSFAVEYVNRSRDLTILACVQHDPTGGVELPRPSWVPRWDRYVNTATLGLHTDAHYAALNKDVVLVSSSGDGPPSLAVRGKILKRVCGHSQLLTAGSFDIPELRETGNGIECVDPLVLEFSYAAKLDVAYRNGVTYPQTPLGRFTDTSSNQTYDLMPRGKQISLVHAFLRTWAAGESVDSGGGTTLERESLAYWSAMTRLYEGGVEAARSMLNARGDPRIDVSDDRVDWERYRDRLDTICHNRKFFFTEDRFMGMGPGVLQENDVVAVLLGSDMPLILREVAVDPGQSETGGFKGKTYRLVGECYVYGVSQGQAVRMSDMDDDIVLI